MPALHARHAVAPLIAWKLPAHQVATHERQQRCNKVRASVSVGMIDSCTQYRRKGNGLDGSQMVPAAHGRHRPGLMAEGDTGLNVPAVQGAHASATAAAAAGEEEGVESRSDRLRSCPGLHTTLMRTVPWAEKSPVPMRTWYRSQVAWFPSQVADSSAAGAM